VSATDWKALGAFGALAVALSLWDGRAALILVGAAALVVVVRHSDQLPYIGTNPKEKKSS
jgi:hypothetical protein